ncbi:hypothetical protein TYRP_004645 [Tyrophagus putrescentiae]|nr:hypothetical protein TYRP_004645 [Tyrophagus putrescentiae]
MKIKDDTAAVRQLIELVAQNFEIISVPPQLIYHCQSQLRLTDRSQIEELVIALSKWLKGAPGSSQIKEQIGTILAGGAADRPAILESFNQAIDQEGGRVKAALALRTECFAETLLSATRCERLSSTGKEFVLDLEVQTDPCKGRKEEEEEVEEAAAASLTRSFVLSEEQIRALLQDMEKIREQLFRSVSASA